MYFEFIRMFNMIFCDSAVSGSLGSPEVESQPQGSSTQRCTQRAHKMAKSRNIPRNHMSDDKSLILNFNVRFLISFDVRSLSRLPGRATSGPQNTVPCVVYSSLPQMNAAAHVVMIILVIVGISILTHILIICLLAVILMCIIANSRDSYIFQGNSLGSGPLQSLPYISALATICGSYHIYTHASFPKKTPPQTRTAVLNDKEGLLVNRARKEPPNPQRRILLCLLLIPGPWACEA